MTKSLLFAQTQEELVRSAQFHERMGWFFMGLAVFILIGGFILKEVLHYRKVKQEKNQQESQSSADSGKE